MLSRFRILVSVLYSKWEDRIIRSLKLPERTYFESIRNKTATEAELIESLGQLCHFLYEKFHQRVLVLIDEYEAPINRAYEHGYFGDVRSLFPSL
jgi:Predicted AAA-ATPase